MKYFDGWSVWYKTQNFNDRKENPDERQKIREKEENKEGEKRREKKESDAKKYAKIKTKSSKLHYHVFIIDYNEISIQSTDKYTIEGRRGVSIKFWWIISKL